MIVLNVTYHCKPGMRQAFIDAIDAEGLAEASRAEAGNICYAYHFSVAEPDDILLLEKWQDQQAFEEHCASAHFKRLGEVKNDFVNETVLDRYDV